MKKEITISIDEETLKEFSNALAAYGDVVWACILGTKVNNKFEKLKTLDAEELTNRFNNIKSLYLEIKSKYND